MAVGAITQKFIVCVGWGDDDGYEFSLHIVMRSIVTALITLAVLGVLILDGSGMFMAYQGAREVARTAAYQAALEYLSTDGNEAAAKQAAAAFVRSKGGEILEIEMKGSGGDNYFQVRVLMHAKTYVLNFIPVANRYTSQEATAFSHL